MLYALMPDLAMRETREATIPPPGYPRHAPKVPPGRYGMVELYCVDPACDCRRVMINVVAEDGRHLATINHAFEPPAPDDPVETIQTYLDPLNKQSPWSAAFLDLFVNVVLADPAYAARLVRHYTMIKEALKDPMHPIHQRIPPERPGGVLPSTLRPPKQKRWKKPR